MDVSKVALLAPNVLANSGLALKLDMNGVAYPLVICNATPRSMEKMKKINIRRSLSNLNASSPRIDMMPFPASFFPAFGISGRKKLYKPRMNPSTELTSSCISVYWKRKAALGLLSEMVNPKAPSL